MSEPIKFRAHFHLEEVAPNMVFLLSEVSCHLLKGDLYYLLAPLLKKGELTADELVDKLAGKAPAAEVYYALERLGKMGFLEKSPHSLPKEVAAFCESFDVASSLAEKKLKETRLYLTCAGKVKEKRVFSALRSLSIQVCSNASQASLILVLCEDYLHPQVAALHKKFHKEKKAWMLAKSMGTEIWLGPLFIPPETGCWECLRVRLEKNRIEESYLRNMKKIPFVPHTLAYLPSTGAFAAEWLATEIFKLIIKPEESKLKGKILSFNSLSSSLQEHQLVKLPQCTSCGKAPSQKRLYPPLLVSRPKNYSAEGDWRSTSFEETLKKHEHQVSPILGITNVLKSAEQKEGSQIKVYIAGHNFALSNSMKGIYHKSFRSNSSGKGKTETQAKAGALCEAIERYCGVFQGNEYRIKNSYAQLKKEAIHPAECLHYSKRQYKERVLHNKTCMDLHYTPNHFSAEKKIEWTPVWSLTEKRFKYLPTAFCYYGYSDEKIPRFCTGDSNGNAAGNCLEEAILQGFFELVERDGVALWWYNRVQRPGIDLDSFNDPYITKLVHEYKSLGREVWALDLTTDLGIPVFVAVSRLTSGKEEKILFGFGSHLNPHIALLRALTEMNQFLSVLPSVESTQEGEESSSENEMINRWLKSALLKDCAYLSPAKNLTKRTARDFPVNETDDLLKDIYLCQKIVEEKGMELLLLDQTRPDIDLHVVKVIVPGLRHFWPRFAPGRLYDVPVKLGWLKKARKEEELNPTPMFL